LLTYNVARQNYCGLRYTLHTVQYNTTKYSTVQYSTIQYTQYDAIQYNTIQYNRITTQHNITADYNIC